MSEKSLEGLRDFLCGTLSAGNILWLCQQLAEYAQKQQEQLKACEKLIARAEEGRKQIALGNYLTSEEVFNELAEEFGLELPEKEMQLDLAV